MSFAGAWPFLPASLILLAARPPAQDGQSARVTPVVAVAQRTAPAVVNVCLESEAAHGEWTARGPVESLGSGLLIDPEGYILTDTHALPRGTGGIRVRLGDGRSAPATLVSLDLGSGVALLKIAARPGHPFPVARLGTSSDLMVGETVIAITNPQGGGVRVSSGIVSALAGAPAAAGAGLIHIDAPIEPGHSGGPVLNVEGEVIGLLHVAADSPAGRAIPVDRVRRSLATRLFDPCLLGEVVSGFDLEPGAGGRDVVVVGVAAGGPAERAGLRAGDRLLGLRGAPVTWEFDVNKALLESGPDGVLPLAVARGDEHLDLELALERGDSPLLQVWRRVGVQIVDHNRYKGVRVARVDPTGPAALLGLRAGDLIDGLDERLLDTTEDLFRTVRGLPRGTPVVVHVWRGRQAWSGPLILR